MKNPQLKTRVGNALIESCDIFPFEHSLHYLCLRLSKVGSTSKAYMAYTCLRYCFHYLVESEVHSNWKLSYDVKEVHL